GENKILVNGGTDISKKPSWIEGPHIIKKYGYYYLISAEGGTGPDHSVVAFRSKNIYGPYESYEKNPILTQRHLSGERKHPVTSAGHADLVELPDGRWYTVFLATRPYKEDYHNTGRETFLTPVVWENEWPLINPGYDEVQYHYPLPLPAKTQAEKNYRSGNFSYREEFNNLLNSDWIFLRTVKEQWYSLTKNKGQLLLNVRPQTVGGRMNPSYVARRQQHTDFTASTSVTFTAKSDNEKAGLLCFMHENYFYFLAVSKEKDQPVVQLFQSPKALADSNSMILLASQPLPKNNGPVYLQAKGTAGKYSFSFSSDNKKWTPMKEVDGTLLSTKVAGGFGGNFVGVTIGMYATSLGKESSNTAAFDWFSYTGNDDVFKK
ncbi:MAG TPA: family 43 glycosylhydrolase, partial [Flavisolibacter sp.]|nr:family 43 glycosylhydrolase [Flavisolibacter sp.]